MATESYAILEWCRYKSQEVAIVSNDDRLFLEDVSGSGGILITSEESILGGISDAYKFVMKAWAKVPENDKNTFRSIAKDR